MRTNNLMLLLGVILIASGSLYAQSNDPYADDAYTTRAHAKREYLKQEKDWEEAKIEVKYKYYIEKQDKRVEKMHKMENTRIPLDFDYGAIPSLSAESRLKLETVRPLTLGQANRISGIRNSDIMLLMVYLK